MGGIAADGGGGRGGARDQPVRQPVPHRYHPARPAGLRVPQPRQHLQRGLAGRVAAAPDPAAPPVQPARQLQPHIPAPMTTTRSQPRAPRPVLPPGRRVHAPAPPERRPLTSHDEPFPLPQSEPSKLSPACAAIMRTSRSGRVTGFSAPTRRCEIEPHKIRPNQHCKQAEQAPRQPVEQRQQHLEMVPASAMTPQRNAISPRETGFPSGTGCCREPSRARQNAFTAGWPRCTPKR